MNCKEARRYINLFFDSELDSKTNFEISEHLSSCDDCSTRFAQEERLEKSFVSIFKEDKDPKADVTWEKVISLFRDQTESEEDMRSDSWSLGKYLVPAAAVVIGIIIMLIVYSRQEPRELTVAAQKCHMEYMTNKIVPSIESISPGEVTRYFSGKFTFPVDISEIPEIKSHHIKLFGAKVCHLNGVSVAYVMYHCCNAPVSVFIISAKDIETFSDMKQYIEGDRILFKSADGITFVAVPTKQNTFACVVADHDTELLRWLADNLART
ncbi:MAG: zf-HC2 domain-containing protein [Candidatus Scalindua sp.]|nr:zf-HC2 domain-containing protein [Candidatus Scalindua sp.]